MTYQKFSKRQLLALTWWNRPAFRNRDAIICDGAIRSGKTVSMAVGFLLWSMSRFDGQIFAICGKTIESLRRNVITLLPHWVEGILTVREFRSENKLVVTCGARQNTYFLFGGRDESSYTLIQGITLAGILLDEVALMPRSFVDQALARCSVSGSKFWFNCNPAGPEHWFYKEWVLKAKEERNALHLHFTMRDNLSLSDDVRERYERMYSGVFYRRYILGEWCVAEGLVYEFDRDKHATSEIPPRGRYYISVDYGTLNPFSAGLWCVDGEKAVRIKEYYYSGRDRQRLKTDEEYYTELERLAGDFRIERVVVDPSAASFLETIRRHGRFSPRKANNEVLPGIMVVSRLLRAGKVLIHKSCTDTIREFGLYCWNTDKSQDTVIKENDHAMDDIRYFCNTILRREFRHFDQGGNTDG